MDTLHNARSRGLKSLIITKDIEKAFDAVWHEGLLYKPLHNMLVPHHCLKLINPYLTNRIIHRKYNKTLSVPFTPHAGVPQGSVIASTLYIAYTHDIPQPINNFTHILSYGRRHASHNWETHHTHPTCSTISQHHNTLRRHMENKKKPTQDLFHDSKCPRHHYPKRKTFI